MKFRFALALLAFATSAFAGTQVIGDGGFCTVSSRREVGLNGRSLVVCRYPGSDVTGDGTPEVIEQILVLKRNGKLDCRGSHVVTLDVTIPRHQAISILPACQ